MRELNGGTQMRDVWHLPAIATWEKSCGKHPTQKPLPLLARIVLASTRERAWILDPFAGSATTGIAANLLNRRFLGVECEESYLKIARERKIEILNFEMQERFLKKLKLPPFPRGETEFVLREDFSEKLPF